MENDDRSAVEAFILERLGERYVNPVRNANGFTQLATSSLLIETLECFRNGLPETPNGSQKGGRLPPEPPAKKGRSKVQQFFIDFFKRHPDMRRLAAYEERAARLVELDQDDDCWGRRGNNTYYKNVRCGILHQGETTRGWRIWDENELFSEELLAINPDLLLNAVEKVLREYANSVARAPRETPLWNNFKAKMSATIDHTRMAAASRTTHA